MHKKNSILEYSYNTPRGLEINDKIGNLIHVEILSIGANYRPLITANQKS